MDADDDSVRKAVHRQTGIAALRRLRQLIDQEKALDRLHARWACRLGVAFVAAAIAVIVWLVLRAPR